MFVKMDCVDTCLNLDTCSNRIENTWIQRSRRAAQYNVWLLDLNDVNYRVVHKFSPVELRQRKKLAVVTKSIFVLLSICAFLHASLWGLTHFWSQAQVAITGSAVCSIWLFTLFSLGPVLDSFVNISWHEFYKQNCLWYFFAHKHKIKYQCFHVKGFTLIVKFWNNTIA